jgi:signal transduction histidine kinase
VGTIISFKDISQIKSMQTEMIRMDRLASLGVLAAGIAHEIKNPLAGIKTMAQSLEEDYNADDPRCEYLTRIIRQVNRLDNMLKTLFIYAKPKPPLRKQYRLQDVVHEIEDLLKQKLADKGIVFEQSYDQDLPKILVDGNQIQQVFINLMLNAIDAVNMKGKIDLSARTLRTRLRAVDRRGVDFPRRHKEAFFVETQLHDTGIGISQQHLKKIFDPFFTTKPQGTGLGLSMVYRIMAANGGEIRAKSTPGKGTTFTLLLPTEE